MAGVITTGNVPKSKQEGYRATKKRKVKKSSKRKYQDGNETWETSEAGYCNCYEESREE